MIPAMPALRCLMCDHYYYFAFDTLSFFSAAVITHDASYFGFHAGLLLMLRATITA